MIPHPPTPAWQGPQAGITQSLLIRYLECPFRFYIYAYCGLQEPEDHLNLIWGDTLHKGLEHLLRGDMLLSSIEAMKEYQYKNYPTAPATYEHTTREMLCLYPASTLINKYGPFETEVKLNEDVVLRFKSHQHEELIKVKFRGKVDVFSPSILLDHKCKGRLYPMETQNELVEDLQMNLYAYITESENWLYELIQIPEAAYRCPERNRQSPKEYAKHIFYNHSDILNGFPIANQRNRWICQIPHYKSMEEIHKYFQFTIAPIVHRLCLYWEHITSSDFDPNNPACYNHLFYKLPARVFDASRTDKYKCHYHSVLTNQATYDSLTPVTNFYSELTE